MAGLKERYIASYAKKLAEEGRKLITKAFETANFDKNKTQNLHDSYGSAVFYNGKEIPNTRRYVGRKAVVGKVDPQGNLILGRAEIDNFFDTYKSSFNGFELVTAAAIFYASILEKGSGRLRRKYRVISGIDSDLMALASKTGGKIVNINM